MGEIIMSIVLNPYLHFNGGQAKDAMEFYKSVFGGELKITTFGELPNPSVTDDVKDLVMHSVLTSEHLQLMASDSGPMGECKVGENVSLSLSGDNSETLTNYFNGLSGGGKVTLPLDKQQWGDTFGMVTDKFDIKWMVNISVSKA
jgi:PhnB protein